MAILSATLGIVYSMTILLFLTQFGDHSHATSSNNTASPNHESSGKSCSIQEDSEESSSSNDSNESNEETPLERPPFTYKRLIFQALLSVQDNKLTLQEIFSFIQNKYPYYNNKHLKCDWKSTLKNLITSRKASSIFKAIKPDEQCRILGKPGRVAGYWTFNPELRSRVIAEAYKNGSIHFSDH